MSTNSREGCPTPSLLSQRAFTPTGTQPPSPERFGQYEDEEAELRDMEMRMHTDALDLSLSAAGTDYSTSSAYDCVPRTASATPMPESDRTFIHDPDSLLSTSNQSIQADDAHMQFTAPEEIDVDTLLASGNMAAVRAHFARLQQAVRHEQTRSSELAAENRTLADATAEARDFAAKESVRARDAERAVAEATEAAAKQAAMRPPPVLMRDGVPMTAGAIVAPTTPRAVPSRHYLVSPMKPTATSISAAQAAAAARAASALAEKEASTRRATQLQHSALEPASRANKHAKGCVRDVRALLSSFAADMHETCKLIVGTLLASDARQGTGSLLARYQAEKKQRQKLHEQLIEMQGNIRVFARVRPLMGNTASNASGGDANLTALGSALLANPNSAGRLVQEVEQDATRFVDAHTLEHAGKVFEFDRVIHQQASQEEVYQHVAPLMQSVVDGHCVSILAYGQTGSGKSYTMDGPDSSNPGVNTRSLRHLFDLLESRPSSEWSHTVKLSAVEIYSETPRDLLLEPSAYKQRAIGGVDASRLEMHQTADGQIVLPGLTERVVNCADDVVHLLNAYVRVNRSTAATSMNECSSRSHSLLFLTVESTSRAAQDGDGDGAQTMTTGKLVLVDLAGSERVKKSEATGQALKEATAINLSLSALGDVLSALRTKAAHVPWRHSKLTFLLSGFFARGKVVLFAQISPSVSDAGESACTLQFAARARAVALGVGKARTMRVGGGATAKLARVETALAEKEVQAEKAASEMKALKEELERERSKAQEAAERIKTMAEQEATRKSTLAQTTSDEVQQLTGLLRAKDREMQQMRASMGSTTKIAARIASPLPESLPTFALATAGATQTPFDEVDAVGSGVAAVEEDMEVENIDHQEIESHAEAESDMDDKENDAQSVPPVRLSSTNSAAGVKRKESPEKANAHLHSAANENGAKKARMPTTTTTTVTTKVLGASTATNMPPASISSVSKPGATPTTISTIPAPRPAFRSLTLAKDHQRTSASSSRPVAKSKVAAAWTKTSVDATMLAAANAAHREEIDADTDIGLASPPSTPARLAAVAATGAKTVRFGPIETKFISPSPPPHSSPTRIAPFTSLGGHAIDTLRARRAPVTTPRTQGGLLGGPKRHAQKAPAWNNSCK